MSQEENLESFAITSRRVICFYLRQLVTDGERVTVTFDEGRDSLLTMLLDADEASGRMIFDWGGSESSNLRLMKSGRLLFVANNQGVRYQFMVNQAGETTYQNRRAFSAPLPEKILRIQRREYFRLSLPSTRRPPCKFRHGDDEQEWSMVVLDIGIGGIALESQTAELPFSGGEIIKQASIDLGKAFGILTIDLEVRSLRITDRGRTKVGWMGCQFAGLKQAQDTQIQRFITKAQQEERARLG